MNITNHAHYMSLALQLAEQGRFTVSPNPMVGCVIVKEDRIVGQGFHRYAGDSHAEVHALREAGPSSKGATAYVSLEPCCHQGRTPPCTEALISAGIKQIYAACLDPNPNVSGKGIAALKGAGIIVHLGLLEAQACALNERFFYYMKHKRPFVIAKWAMSLDGKTSVNPKDSRQISGSESSFHTHQLRQAVDAILVGSRTALCDNPKLTVRIAGETTPPKQPIRIVLSSKANLPPNLTLFDPLLPGKTILATTEKKSQSLYPHVELLILPKNENGQVDLKSLLSELGKREITSLLVEGGMTVHENFFKENLVSKVLVYVAPVIIGALDKKQKVEAISCQALGKDFCFTAETN